MGSDKHFRPRTVILAMCNVGAPPADTLLNTPTCHFHRTDKEDEGTQARTAFARQGAVSWGSYTALWRISYLRVARVCVKELILGLQHKVGSRALGVMVARRGRRGWRRGRCGRGGPGGRPGRPLRRRHGSTCAWRMAEQDSEADAPYHSPKR